MCKRAVAALSLAVMGATGSGKTTALRVWGGLAAPRAGSVQVASLPRPPHRMRPDAGHERKRKIGRTGLRRDC